MYLKMMLIWKKPISLLNAHFEAQLLTIIIIAVIFENTYPVNNYRQMSPSNMVLQV